MLIRDRVTLKARVRAHFLRLCYTVENQLTTPLSKVEISYDVRLLHKIMKNYTFDRFSNVSVPVIVCQTKSFDNLTIPH